MSGEKTLNLRVTPEIHKLFNDRAAERKSYRRSDGPKGAALARDLLESALPLFESCGFDPEAVSEEVGRIAARRKKGTSGR